MSQEHELEELRLRVGELEKKVDESTAALKRVESNTNDLVDVLAAAQGAFKVLNWIGKLARPLGYIAMAVGAIAAAWTAIKGAR